MDSLPDPLKSDAFLKLNNLKEIKTMLYEKMEGLSIGVLQKTFTGTAVGRYFADFRDCLEEVVVGGDEMTTEEVEVSFHQNKNLARNLARNLAQNLARNHPHKNIEFPHLSL
jgi:hypothetical protein